MGRFLNADAFTSTGQGLLGNNMFVYCKNNPVIGCDPYGSFDIIGAIAGGVIGSVISMISYVASSRGNIDPLGLLGAGIVGALSGVAASTGYIGSALAGVVALVYTYATTDGSEEQKQAAAIAAFAFSFAGGALSFTGCDVLLKGIGGLAYGIGSAYINYVIGQIAELLSLGSQGIIDLSMDNTNGDYSPEETSTISSPTLRHGGGGASGGAVFRAVCLP